MTTHTLDLDEASARLGRLYDLLAGASAYLSKSAEAHPEAACHLVLEARSLAAQVRDQLDSALALEHEKRRAEHGRLKAAVVGR